MKKDFILISILFMGLFLTSASGKKMTDVKVPDLNAKKQKIQSTTAVKPDLNFDVFKLTN